MASSSNQSTSSSTSSSTPSLTPSATSSSTSSSTASSPHGPKCVILLGMAGSGKSSCCSQLTKCLFASKTLPYVINCDPAVTQIPYECNVDIRDTVDYKAVMKKYHLGPNGAIITSLNLFSTQFHSIIELIHKRKDQYEYVVFDSPGQIEVFTWSASGSIMTETLAAHFPTIIVYVMDTVRSQNPVTFMSNMLYACSIVYKYKLPIVIAMNKCDVVDNKFAIEWMRDWESFQASVEQDSSYSANLTRSLSLVLDTFYENLTAVGVSAATGAGFDKLIKAIDAAALEYEREYRPQYERIKKEAEIARQEDRQKQMARAKADAGEGTKVELLSFGDPAGTYNNDDDDDDDDHNKDEVEDDEEEKKEYQDFKKFLAMQKATNDEL